jgi:hypothetical protein
MRPGHRWAKGVRDILNVLPPFVRRPLLKRDQSAAVESFEVAEGKRVPFLRLRRLIDVDREVPITIGVVPVLLNELVFLFSRPRGVGPFPIRSVWPASNEIPRVLDRSMVGL